MNIKSKIGAMENYILIICIIGLSFILVNNLFKKGISAHNAQLDLKTLVNELQTQLVQLEKARKEKKEASLFQIEKADVETNVVAIESYSNKGQIEYKIITVGSEQKYENQQIQKITLHLVLEKPQKEDIPPAHKKNL